MVFKRLLGSLGVGAPTVDTVLDPAPAHPGGVLTGQVRLKGGNADYEIEQIVLELVARVEAEQGDGEREGSVVFDRFTVGGSFTLREGEERDLPFRVTLPWETPVTELHGQSLGVVLGVRTELEVKGAKDKGDLDALAIAPLPAQEAVLVALGRLGYAFRSADLEYGRIGGTGQQLPFYQEIELTPPPQYAGALNEIEVTFLASPGGVEVVLEGDKRGGRFGGGDAIHRHVVGHRDQRDWEAEVDSWVRQLIEQRGAYGPGGGDGEHSGFPGGHAGHGYGEPQHGGERRSGPGMGTVVAAGAAGLAVGVGGAMLANELLGDDEDEGDSDDGGGGDDEG